MELKGLYVICLNIQVLRSSGETEGDRQGTGSQGAEPKSPEIGQRSGGQNWDLDGWKHMQYHGVSKGERHGNQSGTCHVQGNVSNAVQYQNLFLLCLKIFFVLISFFDLKSSATT